MANPPRRRGGLVGLVVLDLTMATLVVGLLVTAGILFQNYLQSHVSYQHAFVGLCFLFGSLGIGLYIHGIALVLDLARKGSVAGSCTRRPVLNGLVPAALYAASLIAATGLFISSSAGTQSLLLDIGPVFSNTILFITIGSMASLCIVIAVHAALARHGLPGAGLGSGTIPPTAGSRGAGRAIALPITRAGVGKLHAIAVLIVIAGGVASYGLSSLFLPSSCFDGFHGFSSLAYDLATIQDGSHANAALDGLSVANRSLLETLERGLWQMTTVQDRGGFPLRALLDGSEFYADRGDWCPLHPGEFSIQDATPLIASVYLAMYELDPDPVYLNVATAAARALIAVQDDVNGGFYYDGRFRPDGTASQPHPFNSRRAAVFDDNTMQSALSFLLDMYDATGNNTYRAAAVRGLDYIFDLEKSGGG